MALIFILFALIPSLAFGHAASQCPGDGSYPPDPFVIQSIPPPGYVDPFMQMANDIHPYLFDKRLGPSAAPWLSPAAAVLYPGIGPPRAYSVNDYIAVTAKIGSNDLTPTVYRVNAIASHGASACFPFNAFHRPYLTNGATFTDVALSRVSIVYGYTQLGCSVGGYRYYYDALTVSAPVSVIPTCSDDVWNGDETGIDCGGSCAECPGQNIEFSAELNSAFIGAVSAGAFALGVFALGGL